MLKNKMPRGVYERKVKPIPIKCSYCNKTIYKLKSAMGQHNYCNIVCFKKGRLLGQGVWNKNKKFNMTKEHKDRLRLCIKKAQDKRVENNEAKYWEKGELEFLKQNYGKLNTRKLAKRLKRSLGCVHTRAYLLGLKFAKEGYKDVRGGEKHHNWKGGRVPIGIYILIYQPTHPYKTQLGYVLEHRLVMEKAIGRYLKPKERVHHIDFDGNNNVIDNLHLFPDIKDHQNYHRFLRRLVLEMLSLRNNRKV